MKNILKTLVLAVFCSVVVGFAAPALAYNPSLSVYDIGGGNSAVSITNAQPNASVVLTYTPAGSSLSTTITGSTDYSGNFSTTINSASGSQVTATVAGQFLNTNNGSGCGYYGCGGCTYNCGNNNGSLSLSQTSLSLNSGQSQTVTIYNNNNNNTYNNNYYVSSNSNSSVATASISGNSVYVYGQSVGSTTISICQNSGQCASLYVTVNGGSCGYYGCNGCTYNCNTGSLTLSPSSVSLNVGQTSNVTASMAIYNPGFYISSNSNPTAVSASVSGSLISLYGLASGSSTISVCVSGGSACANLYVSVSGSSYGGGNVSFSPSSATLYSGQSLAISLNSSSGNAYYAGSNTPYYVSSNSNPGIVSASVSGTVLNLYANQTGSSNITVCLNSLSFCGTLPVTVNGGSGNGNGSLSLSQTSLNLNVGQSASVTANNYSGGSLYIAGNFNSGIASATVSGNTVNIYGVMAGSTTINICTSNNQCANVYVTVGGNGCAYNCGNSNGNLSLSQSSLNVNSGQSQTVTIYNSNNYNNNNNSNSFYVSSNSNSSVATASISGNSIYVYGQNIGSTTISICQNSGQCVSLYVTVGTNGGCTYNCGNNSGNLYFNTTSLPVMTIGQYYSYQIQANGGTAPYNYSLVSGNLPYGLSLSSYGLITGVPTANVYTTFQIRVTDNYGRSATASFSVGNNYGGCSYNCGGLSYPGGSVMGATNYPSGELISEGPTIYMVYKNLKTPFASASAFLGLGFNFGNVVAVGDSGLANSGYTVSSSYVQHPWGTWVKSGSTVYFVHESGLIPVPNMNIFAANGGQDNFVVPANYYDLRLPRLSIMTQGDSRMQ